jgi:hypothetical protein
MCRTGSSGFRLVLSANRPAQVTLLYPSQILFSDNGGIEIDSTEQAACPSPSR